MKRPPIILISPDIESKGKEFADLSISLSRKYQEAVLAAGGLPLTMPATVSRRDIAACVSRSDGVMLTGGDDIEPSLYTEALPAKARRTIEVTPDGGQRTFRELLLIDEVFHQRKPLLAICRGHQILNLALGGTLFADIATQVTRALNHRRMALRSEIVHEVRLTAGSVLAKITDRQILGVNSTHHQAVDRVAAPLRVSAVSCDGIIEGLELKPNGARGLPFLVSVQFHPERLVDRHPEHQAIFDVFARACGKKNL
jgi:putative glutamine amidotransferase